MHKRISQALSRYTVDVKELDGSENGNVLGGDYDFCFMPRDMLPESPSVESIVTHSEQLYVIADKTNTAAKQKNISMADLANEKLVLLSENVSPILYMRLWIYTALFIFHPKSQIHLTM